MAFIDFLYGTTVWTLGIIVSAIFVGGTIVALLIVDRLWAKELRRSHNDIAGFLIAVVGVVFAILVSSLAIIVMSRQDRAESFVREEAQVLEAIYRESDLVAPDLQAGIRRDVLTYLDAVIDGDWPQMQRAEWPTAAAAASAGLWRDVAAMPVTNFAQMLTVQDLRHQLDKLAEIRRGRSAIATSGVDRVVWSVVLLGSISTILFAVVFGVPNFIAHLLMTSLLAFTIALAIIMIVAVDWPYFGNSSVGPQGLQDLRQSLAQGAAPATPP